MSNVAVIVGVGPGIGLAVAKKFAQEGFRVALVARDLEKVNGYVEQFRADGLEAHALAGDAAQPGSLEAAMGAVKTQLGAPDVLVYNAASYNPGVPSSLTRDVLLTGFTINVIGALEATNAVLDDMKKNASGTVLFTGGGLALNPYKDYASLGIGKAGIRSLAFAYAQELGPHGIHVATVTVSGSVQPGTPFDPDKIAAHYWRLHTQEKGAWETEHVYKGEA
jgi:NAD(P)-dependent dehydrogenase (short-subunit alcohol dehydrogenase family)